MEEEEIKKHRDQLERDCTRRYASNGITEAAYQDQLSKNYHLQEGQINQGTIEAGLASGLGITLKAYEEAMTIRLDASSGAARMGTTKTYPSYVSHPVTPMDAFDKNEHDTEFLQHVAKFYVNGSIPIYRRYIKSANQWEYRLFEDNVDGHVLFISCHGQTITDHLRFILEAIDSCCSGMKSMKRAR